MISIEDIQLSRGNHKTRETGLCVMEAVAWIAGEEHTDMPKCVSPVISKYCQVLNDSGNDAVRERLKPYIYKMIGTASPELDEQRAFIAADFAVRVFAKVDCEPIVDMNTANAAYAAANANAGRAAANAAYAAANAARAARALAHAAHAANAAHAAHAANAAAANAAYAANAADDWDGPFRCLDAMLWPAPSGGKE